MPRRKNVYSQKIILPYLFHDMPGRERLIGLATLAASGIALDRFLRSAIIQPYNGNDIFPLRKGDLNTIHNKGEHRFAELMLCRIPYAIVYYEPCFVELDEPEYDPHLRRYVKRTLPDFLVVHNAFKDHFRCGVFVEVTTMSNRAIKKKPEKKAQYSVMERAGFGSSRYVQISVSEIGKPKDYKNSWDVEWALFGNLLHNMCSRNATNGKSLNGHEPK